MRNVANSLRQYASELGAYFPLLRLPFSFKTIISFYKSERDLFGIALFVYFFTLHADQLGFTVHGLNIRVNNVVAMALFIFFIARYRLKMCVMDKKLFYPLLLITLSFLLSLFFSPYQARCLLFTGWWGLTILCYILLPYFLTKVWNGDKVFSLYCISFLCVGVYALLQLMFSCLGLNDPFAHQRIVSNLVRPNAFTYEPSFYALYMTPFITMCNFHYMIAPETSFFCFQKLTFKKIVFFNFLFLISTATTTLFAYGIFIFSLLCIPTFKMLRKKVIQFTLVLSAFLTVSGIFYPLLIKNYLMKFAFYNPLSHASFYERWGGIVNAWHVFLKYPLLGVGLGGYSPFLLQAWLQDDSSFTYFITVSEAPHLLKLFEPSNVFTEILASLGIFGLCAFGSLLIAFLIYAKKAFVSFSDADTSENGKKCTLALSVIVMLIVMQINQGLLRTYTWVHLSLVFAYLEKLEDIEYFSSSRTRI